MTHSLKLLSICGLVFAVNCLTTGCINIGSNDVLEFNSPEELKYCQPVMPFAEAMAKGDYEAAYDALDPMCLKDVHASALKRDNPNYQLETKGNQVDYVFKGDPDDRFETLSKEQFVEAMKAGEAYGKPKTLDSVYVEGFYDEEAMERAPHQSADFPFDKVKATVSIDITCECTKENLEAMQKLYGWDEGELEEGYTFAWMYIVVYVIEDEGELKMGRFQFNRMEPDW
ncbi:MAG: hypothetical protein AAFN77_04015 [Planctomycetota bacterium]